MCYMNDGCDPFGIPYIEYENKKTIKKEKDKLIERFTYNGCIIYDNINNERMEIWETTNFLNELVKENEQLKEQREKLLFRERDTKNRWRELKQENEQLKNICKNLINEVNKRGITVNISDEYKELLE